MTIRVVSSILGKRSVQELYGIGHRGPLLQAHTTRKAPLRVRSYATVREENFRKDPGPPPSSSERPKSADHSSQSSSSASTQSSSTTSFSDGPEPPVSSYAQSFDWDDNPDLNISKFSELPEKNFGVNQHIIINEETKEALRQILWQFKAPIRYAFAYGSGVFPQSGASATGSSTLHSDPPAAVAKMQKGGQKMIDFIFGVSYSQHWHSLNIQQHRDHYSALASLGSYAVANIQDDFGSGMYFHPYVTVNGTLIKYGVCNLDTLCKDLSEWNTMYLAGRLQKPVKILRDNPSVRLANQVNLISAVRTALLLLPEDFTEQQLYSTIAGISYMGDPRMSVGGDDPRKVDNIVKHQLTNFRRLYAPLIDNLPNISFTDSQCSHVDWMDDDTIDAKLQQSMNPETRGHMVRRLPTAFRQRLYFEYQSKFQITRRDFRKLMEETSDEDPDRIRTKQGGPFEQRIAKDEEGGGLREEVKQVIEKTIRWPAFTQSVKSVFTAGVSRSWRYVREKREKAKKGKEEKEQKKD